ncbi:MAG: ATP-binding protein [Terriglobales bacterium]
MRNRNFWFQKIEAAWQRGNFVWLSGVVRSGKSSVVQNLPQVEYMDCSVPAVRRSLDHPLEVFSRIEEGRVALDEINRLVDPFPLIELVRKHFPEILLVATSAAPTAQSAGGLDLSDARIEDIWLTPMISDDLSDFQQHDLQRRFIRGGLPPLFLSESFPEHEFQAWMDEYWQTVVQEFFRLERRSSFQKFVEQTLINSGDLFESTRYAAEGGVSRTTITNYLSVLEKTYVVNLVRPFNSRRSTEIIAAPRAYAFDTGFVAFHRGWNQLRRADFGTMWLHFVLNELHAEMQTRQLYYWKDKRGHKIDFIFARRIHSPTAIECAWSSSDFDPSGLISFRKQYPNGENIVVCHDVTQPFVRTYKYLTVKFVPLHQLVDEVLAA